MSAAASCGERLLNSIPHVLGRGPCNGAIQVFLGGHGAPSIENLARLIDHEHTRLEKAFWMLNCPVCSALQKLRFTAAREESKPGPLVTDGGNFLMRVTDILEIKIPVGMRLICKMLRLAGDREQLATRRSNFFYDAFVNIAP